MLLMFIIEEARRFILGYFVLIACGQVVNNTLKSPGYPNDYQNGTYCFYVIPIPQGTRLNITFQDFDVEPESECRYVMTTTS